MAIYYADSSVLTKRHIREVGTRWVEVLTDPIAEHLFITSRISMAEVSSALNRRQREGTLTGAQYGQISTDFAALCATTYQFVEVTVEIVTLAQRLLERHALRAYDAVQLASGLMTNNIVSAGGDPPLIFLAADDRLLGAAQLEGLATDSPNRHP